MDGVKFAENLKNFIVPTWELNEILVHQFYRKTMKSKGISHERYVWR